MLGIDSWGAAICSTPSLRAQNNAAQLCTTGLADSLSASFTPLSVPKLR